MLALIKPFFELSILRLAPQDLPASPLLLGVALAANTLSAVLLWAVLLPVGSALVAGFTDTLLLAVLTLSLLYAHRVQKRVRQTLTALAGVGALIGLIALPVTSWLHAANQTGNDTDLPSLLLLGLIGWSLAAAGHILRHALSSAFVLGLVVALVFYWITINVMNTLFPVPI